MRILYLDTSMGVAGDMLCAALLDLYENPNKKVEELNGLGIPYVRYELEDVTKSGIRGKHLHVYVNEQEEGHEHHHHHHDDHNHEHHHEHEHHHDHEHEHHHHGNHLSDINHIISGHLSVSEKVKKDALSVYETLANAEAKVHGMPVNEIHFHEVGQFDAIADIVGACYLLEGLKIDKVVSTPINTGSGTVKCAHGILPVPAPATAELLIGQSSYSDGIKGELCTPTGAALTKHFVSEYKSQPSMVSIKTGYGMGTKEFERVNCVRAILGETDGLEDDVIELSFNVDDMTGEEISYALEMLFKNGAFEAYTIAVDMKKNRPGNLIRTMCSISNKQRILETIFKYTTTIGVREIPTHRYVLDRKEVKVETE